MPWRARTIVQRHCALRASRPQLKREPLGRCTSRGVQLTEQAMNPRGTLIGSTIAGGILALPLGFLIWAGAEHGGRGPLTIVWAMAFGAVVGSVVGGGLLFIRAVYRRGRRARWTMQPDSRVHPPNGN